MRAPRNSAKLSLVGLVLLGLLAAVLSAAALLSNPTVSAEPPAPATTSATPETSSSPTTAPTTASPSPDAQPTSATPSTPSQSSIDDVGTVVVIGDSNSVGEPSETWVGAAAEALGWAEVVNLSSPGRGYITAPRSCDFDPCGTFAESIPAIVEASPSIVVTFGGTADGDYSLSEAASAYFEALRAELPEAELIAVAPVTSAETADYWLTLHARTIGAGVEAVDGKLVNPGQPGVGDGDQLSAEAQAAIAQSVIEELA